MLFLADLQLPAFCTQDTRSLNLFDLLLGRPIMLQANIFLAASHTFASLATSDCLFVPLEITPKEKVNVEKRLGDKSALAGFLLIMGQPKYRSRSPKTLNHRTRSFLFFPCFDSTCMFGRLICIDGVKVVLTCGHAGCLQMGRLFRLADLLESARALRLASASVQLKQPRSPPNSPGQPLWRSGVM